MTAGQDEAARSQIARRARFEAKYFPEVEVGGFSRLSPGILFWSRIAALIEPQFRVLDYGAGRGAFVTEDRSDYARWLKTLKGRVAHVSGCDVDPAVLENPTLDDALVIDPKAPLPYGDGAFDMVISSYVLEHVDDPAFVASELARVTRPGGWICATTANRNGYVALAARLVPNRLHVRALNRIMPWRPAQDVFPTRYRMNSRRALRRIFAPYGKVWTWTDSGEPAYDFGLGLVYRGLMLLHRVLPQALHTGLFLFVRRSGGAT